MNKFRGIGMAIENLDQRQEEGTGCGNEKRSLRMEDDPVNTTQMMLLVGTFTW